MVYHFVHVPQWQRECVESAFSGRSSRPMHTKLIEMILSENRFTLFGIMPLARDAAGVAIRLSNG